MLTPVGVAALLLPIPSPVIGLDAQGLIALAMPPLDDLVPEQEEGDPIRMRRRASSAANREDRLPMGIQRTTPQPVSAGHFQLIQEAPFKILQLGRHEPSPVARASSGYAQALPRPSTRDI